MHSNRKREFLLLSGIMAASALLGLLGDMLLPSLLAGISGYTAWHLYRLDRLPGIIRQHTVAGKDYRTGLWSEVITALESREAETRQSEHELSLSLERLRNTMAALPTAIIILGQDESIEWANTAATTLLGIDSADAARQQLATLVKDPILREYLSRGDYSMPLTLSAPADRLKTLLLQVMTIGGDDDRLVIVAQDISRQYHLDATQRDFIANISHELRTPLTVITGLLEQMEDADHDATGRQVIALMQKQAFRMRDLIADLMALMQIESGQRQQQQETVDVPDLVEAIVREARAIDGEHGHVLLPVIDRGHGLHGNAGELRAVFLNLVVNAIRHTPDRAEIRINWSAGEDGAVFSVSDSGEGIPARHIPRLTERFYRVDNSRSRDTGGSGLGLSIVRQGLDKHDARLEISSSVGRGSTFSCHFPASRVTLLETAEA